MDPDLFSRRDLLLANTIHGYKYTLDSCSSGNWLPGVKSWLKSACQIVFPTYVPDREPVSEF